MLYIGADSFFQVKYSHFYIIYYIRSSTLQKQSSQWQDWVLSKDSISQYSKIVH